MRKNGELNFLKNLVKFFTGRKEKITVFDIGGNIGNWTEAFLEVSKNLKTEIHIFEPLSSSFEEIKRKFSTKENIKLLNFGLSDKNEERYIFFDKEKSPFASLYKRPDVNFIQSEKVKLKRADEYIKENGIEGIDLVKIDVEGHELKVLLGFGEFLNPDFISFIQFEYAGLSIYSETKLYDLYQTLESRGYKIAKIKRKGLELREYKTYMENFVYANYVAVSPWVLKQFGF